MKNELDVTTLFTLAQRNLDAAKTLKATSDLDTPYEIICYNCHQSAEKYLKGFLDLRNALYPKTHSLQLLVNLCSAQESRLGELLADCNELSGLEVKTRYENPFEFTEHDMKRAYDCAVRIRREVLACSEEIGYVPPDAYQR
jgi:HEPN domain-containing protein